jgi:3',5'-cyclic AMP phosphodiesterase CpdA
VRRLVHLSDLHFGRTDPELLEPFVAAVRRLRPDLLVISGDLTQRARTQQFRQARAFLERLPRPQLVVPGNHDVPLHNLFARALRPLAKYRRHITEELEPFYADDEIAVLGVNTARSLTIAGGRIALEQIARARERLCRLPGPLVKFVVTHHPFDLPEWLPQKHIVGRAHSAVSELVRSGADVFLSGHLHVCHAELTTRRYHTAQRAALLIQVGTGLSSRLRGEPNKFNVLHTSDGRISVETFSWLPHARQFVSSARECFHRTPAGWDRTDTGPSPPH